MGLAVGIAGTVLGKPSEAHAAERKSGKVLIAYYSRWYVFEPGDVITTGSPAGVGMGRKPFVFLKPGDVVTLGAEGIGYMHNPVIAEE